MMLKNYELPYDIGDMARLPVADIALSVPVLEDVLQLEDFSSNLTKTGIIVATNEDNVTRITRTDGNQLQFARLLVSLNTSRRKSMIQTRRAVFTQPMPYIQYEPSFDEAGEAGWQLTGDNLEVANEAALAVLTQAIGSYALIKFQKTYAPNVPFRAPKAHSSDKFPLHDMLAMMRQSRYSE